MQTTLLAVALAVSLVSAAPYAPTCRAPGERCKGVYGRTHITWIPCCDGACDTPHADWGMICTPDRKSDSKNYVAELPKCRAPGERCKGVYGRTHITWIPCCDGACDTPHADWGKVCTPKHSDHKGGSNYAADLPKCRKLGERCVGAAYMPYVPWVPCCEGGCNAQHKDWGMMCSLPIKVADKKYAAEMPKCRKEGERCVGAPYMPYVPWVPCCDGECNAPHPWWGTMCAKVAAKKPYVAPLCAKKDEYCGVGYEKKCCDKLECVKETMGYKSKCVAPKPKCLADGAVCGKGYLDCCGNAMCVKNKIGKGSKCVVKY